jgi:hypothetical protein
MEVQFPRGREFFFLFATVSSQLWGLPTHPPVQRVLGSLSLRVKQLEHELIHLVLRLRMHGAIPPIHAHLLGKVLV